jgi:hypothetical protein
VPPRLDEVESHLGERRWSFGGGWGERTDVGGQVGIAQAEGVPPIKRAPGRNGHVEQASLYNAYTNEESFGARIGHRASVVALPGFDGDA